VALVVLVAMFVIPALARRVFPALRMIAASIVLYIGLGIILAITVWNHWSLDRR
jgi:hypothetical protein